MRNFKITPSTILFLLSVIIVNLFIIFNIYHIEDKKKDTFRIHVVANSNALEDQIVKLKVENKLDSYIENLDFSSETIQSKLQENANQILAIANQVLQENEQNYTSTLEIGKIYYDEKENSLLTMRQGTYESAKLILGEGQGKNIFTLIFPEKEDMENIQNLNSIVPGIETLYQENTASSKNYSFKILEILDEFKNMIQKSSTFIK